MGRLVDRPKGQIQKPLSEISESKLEVADMSRRSVLPFMLFLMIIAIALGTWQNLFAQDADSAASAQASAEARLPDHDGDGTSNCQDADYTPPRDGTGQRVNARGEKRQAGDPPCQARNCAQPGRMQRMGRGHGKGMNASTCCSQRGSGQQKMHRGRGAQRGNAERASRGSAWQRGRGGCCGQGQATSHLGQRQCQLAPTVAVAVEGSAKPLSEATRKALIAAIEDEYKARALYETVLKEHNGAMPFANIIHAEARHIGELKALLTRYSVPIPADAYTGKIEAPKDLTEARKTAIQAEIDNVAMYDDMMGSINEPDIVSTFQYLRSASQDRHLRAFQRWANVTPAVSEK